MEFGKKLALFLLVSVCSVSCFPSRPLNDRPSELAWQAWLLVDSQNQLNNESDRRITPKSVFIAPKLGQRNDSLPDCADGYRADAMGRCIKFVKVDEAAHLNFLLNRLNQMYAAQSSEEYEETEESMPTAGPLQVNIPLGQAEDSDSNTEIEIVVAPTNGQFDDKVNVKRHHDTRTSEKEKSDTEQVEVPPMSEEEGGEDFEDESTDENETTTQTEETTTTDATTEINSTIPTEESTETTESITTLLPNVADEGLKALFFLMPTNNSTNEKQNATSIVTALNSMANNEKAPVPINEGLSVAPHHAVEDIASFIEPVEHHKSSNLRFPDDKRVKFPDIADSIQDDQRSDFLVDNVKNYYSNPEYHKPHGGELTPGQIQQIFRQYVQRPAAYVDRSQVPHQRVFNHRNRDRNEDLWKLTPTLRDEGIGTPLGPRFGRYPAPYYPQGLYNPKHLSPHHEVQYYGEETGQDYSNLYGRKRRRGNLR